MALLFSHRIQKVTRMSDDITVSVDGEDGVVVSHNAGIRFVGEDALVRVWPSSPRHFLSMNCT